MASFNRKGDNGRIDNDQQLGRNHVHDQGKCRSPRFSFTASQGDAGSTMKQFPRTIAGILLVFAGTTGPASTLARTALGINPPPVHDAARVGMCAEAERILRPSPQARDGCTE